MAKIKKNYIIIMYIGIVLILTLAPYKESIYYGVSYNITPFKSIGNYLRHMGNFGLINWSAVEYLPFGFLKFALNIFTVSFSNLLGNIILFLPLGILVPTLVTKGKGIVTLSAGLLLSGLIEIGQFLVLSSRRADIDDIILNVLGAMIGYGIFRILNEIKGKPYEG